MKLFYSKHLLEAGVDEVARGCLAGRVYSAAVIWPKELDPDLEIEHPVIKDSKKLSRKRRDYLVDYIEATAIDYSVGWAEAEEIDDINIQNATYKAMHNAIDGLNVGIDFLLVDGNKFNPYFDTDNNIVSHKCVIDGDNKYASIACASIIAKVAHDNYIDTLCDENPELEERYGWRSNMCYGTPHHIAGIKEYGITSFHRKTFGICKNYC